AELVDEQQALGARRLPDFLETQEPPAERRAVREQVLLVADRGDEAAQKGKTGLLRRRHRQAALMHQRQEPRRLERPGLAPAVGPGHRKPAPLVAELAVERHARAVVAGLAQGERAQLAQARVEERVAPA